MCINLISNAIKFSPIGSFIYVTLMIDDTVIFSSSPIPGNSMSINRIINKLYLKGAKVYTNTSEYDVHTSGHAKQEELKLLLRLIRPKYFMPMHGEYRMLVSHTNLGVLCDIPRENTFVCKNGDIMALKDGVVYRKGSIPINDIYVDGNRIGDVGVSIIKDRKIMSTDGVLIVILNIDLTNKKLLLEPNITTRGFVVVNDNQEVKYKDILQYLDKRNERLDDVVYGFRRFIVGLGKKVILANTMGEVTDKVFLAGPDEISASIAWLGIVSYSLQLFFDFSGYCG